MNKFHLFCVLFFVCLHCFSQNSSKADSLINLLPGKKDDSTKVKILIKISEEYSLNNPQKSLHFAEEAYSLSERLNWDKGRAMSLNRISYVHDVRGNFSLALEFRLKELKIREDQKDSVGICNALSIIGISYSDQGNFIKAMEYYLGSLKFAEKIGDHERQINNLCNIASVHKELGDTSRAFEFYSKSLELAKKYNYENFISVNYGNLGNIYGDRKNYTKAIEYYLIALMIDQKLGNKRNIAAWLCNIADALRFQSDSASKTENNSLMKEKNSKAIGYYLEAMKSSKEIGNNYILAHVLLGIGATHLIGKQYSEADEYFNKSFELASHINYTDIILLLYKNFFELHKRKNNSLKSLEYYEKYVALKDSVFNEKNKRIISELQIKYESEKKEGENKALAQQNEVQALLIKNNRYFIIGLSGILIFILCLGGLLFYQGKLKSQNLTAQFKQKLLRSQMNPHFIFNSLASIESYIYDHQPKEAGLYLSNFARLMRLILENSESEFITLEKEIEILNFYLSLQKMRLDDNLDYIIIMDQTLNPEEIYLPPMLAQPFIENAIEHGFRGIKHPGKIKISFTVTQKNLVVQIIDNGIGIVQSQNQKNLNKIHKSMAMEITRERLNILNRNKKRKFHYSITEQLNYQKEISGTKVVFSIPV